MKLEEAVILLINKKIKKIRSYKARSYQQTLSSIKYWLFKDKDKDKNWESFFKATDWEPENEN